MNDFARGTRWNMARKWECQFMGSGENVLNVRLMAYLEAQAYDLLYRYILCRRIPHAE